MQWRVRGGSAKTRAQRKEERERYLQPPVKPGRKALGPKPEPPPAEADKPAAP
jgi:hypothetical protein